MRFEVEEDDVGQRVDQFLARRLTAISRVQVREAITEKLVSVSGNHVKPAYKLRMGEWVECPELAARNNQQVAEEVDLDILYEDEHLAAVNKPPGMVTHPAKGHWDGTLTAALLGKFRQLSDLGGESRPGIVHRLDRDTSGVLVIAKHNEAHQELSRQFADRETEKEYLAIVSGTPDVDRDFIDQPIAPHSRNRDRMAVAIDDPSAKSAQTFYEVVERFQGFAAVAVFPKTGRTHQIRVHLAHVGYPVLCDRQYGSRARITKGELEGNDDAQVILGRTALHARRLKIKHPATMQDLEFVAPVPADIHSTLDFLRATRAV